MTCSEPPHIRVARLTDLPGIVRIYNQTIPDRNATCDLTPATLEERIPWFHSHQPPYPLWVGVENGRVAGWACISPFSQKEGYRKTVENSVYVDREFRGRGWGKRLLEHTIEECRRLDFHVIVGRIFSHNPTSLALHKHFGFVEAGCLKEVAYMDGEYYDVAYLIKHLPVLDNS